MNYVFFRVHTSQFCVIDTADHESPQTLSTSIESERSKAYCRRCGQKSSEYSVVQGMKETVSHHSTCFVLKTSLSRLVARASEKSPTTYSETQNVYC